MKSFVQRLSEPSTWAGLAVLGALFGINAHTVATVGQVAGALVPAVPADGGGYLGHIITAVAAGLAVLLPESQAAAPAAAGAPAPQAPAAQ